MYTHASNRDGSIVEDFLSSFAKRLPLKEGEEDPKANKQIDAAIAQIKKLKGADLGDDQSNKDMGELMEAERADTIAEWENLKMMKLLRQCRGGHQDRQICSRLAEVAEDGGVAILLRSC